MSRRRRESGSKMSMNLDYKAMDMPTHLSRSVLRQDPNDYTKWVKDEEWYKRTKIVHKTLLNFYIEHGLLERYVECPLENVVLMFSDFTNDGRKLLKSGAVDRWLSSFDRPGSRKNLDDTSILDRSLRSIQGDS